MGLRRVARRSPARSNCSHDWPVTLHACVRSCRGHLGDLATICASPNWQPMAGCSLSDPSAPASAGVVRQARLRGPPLTPGASSVPVVAPLVHGALLECCWSAAQHLHTAMAKHSVLAEDADLGLSSSDRLPTRRWKPIVRRQPCRPPPLAAGVQPREGTQHSTLDMCNYVGILTDDISARQQHHGDAVC